MSFIQTKKQGLTFINKKTKINKSLVFFLHNSKKDRLSYKTIHKLNLLEPHVAGVVSR